MFLFGPEADALTRCLFYQIRHFVQTHNTSAFNPNQSVILSYPRSVSLAPFTERRRIVLERLNQWLTLLSNLGVIAGIVFLGLEIQQNNAAINAQNYQSRADAVLDLSLVIMDSEHFAPLLAEMGGDLFPSDLSKLAKLSTGDRLRMTAYYQWLRTAIDNQLYQYSNGLIDEGFVNNATRPAMQTFTPIWEQLNLLGPVGPAFLEEAAPYRSSGDG